MKKLTLSLFFLFFSVSTGLFAEDKIGVLLMHGKLGTANSGSPIGQLESYLADNDLIVFAPDMPWHREREFDKSHSESMKEIDEHVQKLKDRGATKIFVGGHSLGANAAIGYGTTRDGLAGILAIAPGHTPERDYTQSATEYDWKRAKQMVDAGKGGDVSGFKDLNQGSVSEIETTANIYLSWFDPNGPASMPANVPRLKAPLLWIIGERDRMYERGEAYAFSKAPANARNAYIVVKGGHKVTPKKGKSEILEWITN